MLDQGTSQLRGALRNETLWHKTKGDMDYKTHVMGNRWEQSGFRGDVRPVTHKERQATWNERRVRISQ